MYTLGEILELARLDLLDIKILCRYCHRKLSTEEILLRELEARESGGEEQFSGYRKGAEYLWISLCEYCKVALQKRLQNVRKRPYRYAACSSRRHQYYNL
ncbi:E6 [Pygoscelis adeliae papillomavirus 2]|uniref:E6 n=1 Tax=Pygoscelis adeliae papillomavirus 2 TaxID=2045113 RepID=A0A291PWL4_9PAPI|nr:E6 [Pygoscelis adeliae papillomavirus 2]